jgi:hypothetical protein
LRAGRAARSTLHAGNNVVGTMVVKKFWISKFSPNLFSGGHAKINVPKFGGPNFYLVVLGNINGLQSKKFGECLRPSLVTFSSRKCFVAFSRTSETDPI